ncbi:hypothetical protein IMCC20628_02744 [Hoeflea sp. IMCC20628]|uniref:hypothetical protein n=1 Tax=Hoeflea sp. IMCC20628 TaxID=1620421 RepID=UPI00063BF694|nr:hypothetical protein [Hoeflea sp. IMCC20628]AKI01440.1 hypothetical protein IMCC20628_02744 [Hoeflea sp. IMCC20628]
MLTDTYLSDTTYQNLIEALLKLTPSALEIECTDRLKMILGETARIWPDSIRSDEPAG